MIHPCTNSYSDCSEIWEQTIVLLLWIGLQFLLLYGFRWCRPVLPSSGNLLWDFRSSRANLSRKSLTCTCQKLCQGILFYDTVRSKSTVTADLERKEKRIINCYQAFSWALFSWLKNWFLLSLYFSTLCVLIGAPPFLRNRSISVNFWCCF